MHVTKRIAPLEFSSVLPEQVMLKTLKPHASGDLSANPNFVLWILGGSQRRALPLIVLVLLSASLSAQESPDGLWRAASPQEHAQARAASVADENRTDRFRPTNFRTFHL